MSALEAGKLFERYRIIRQLGSGISGESYEAEDIILLRKVTLKLIHPWSALSDAARRQFFREMQGISILNHPYLASILDYGEVNDKLYIARRYVSSGSLLGNEGRFWYRPPLPIADAIHYGHQLAQALEYIHKHGYLHGSLGFANILVLRGPNPDNQAGLAPFLLADVGLANFVRRFGELQIKFLPITAAPEQLGQRVTQASDQFALAVLIYFWLTGRPPYLGTPEEIEEQKLTEAIPSLHSLNPKASIEQDVVLRRALTVYPEDRYPSVLTFANALLTTLPAQTQPDIKARSTTQLADIPQSEPHEALEEVKAAPAVKPEMIQPTEAALNTEPESVLQIETIATESEPGSGLDTQSEFAPEATVEAEIESVESESLPAPLTDTEHEALVQLAEDAPQPQQVSDSIPQPTPDVPQPTPDPVPQPAPDVPQPLPTPDVPEPTPDPVPQPAPDPIPQPAPDVPPQVPDPVPQVVPDVPQPLPEPDTPPSTPEPGAQNEPLTGEELPISQELVTSAQDSELAASEQGQETPTRLEEPETVPLTRLVILSPYTEEPYEVLLERDETTIGRAGSSDVLLDHDNSTSRHHALLKREGDHYVLYDRRSANGVFVNGQMLMGEMGYVLEDGDHISIGNYELIFRCRRPETAEEAEESASESEALTSWSFF